MSTLEILKQRAAKAKRQAAMLEAKIHKQARSEATRRKVLLGVAIVDLCESNPDLKAVFDIHLDWFITRPMDRAVLGLTVMDPEKATGH